MKYEDLMKHNHVYGRMAKRWRFLLDSYIGGELYRRGEYLTRYTYENNQEYNQRIEETPVDNHCRGVIQTYVSFLFRNEPQRDFGTLATDPGLEGFIEDADLEGRSLEAFMKDASSYASVFGHVWLLLSKPQTNSLTRADELGQGVRPYVNMVSPLNVYDWEFRRSPSGVYELVYLRYEENDGGDQSVIKEWTPEVINTYVISHDEKQTQEQTQEPNGLGRIPAVILYNEKSLVRGLGQSDIEDIADQQKTMYNESSEIIQLIRLANHPALVKTADVEASAGAGAIVQMPDNLDPGLKPYLLQPSASNLESLFNSQKHKVESIDRMASLGSIRAVQARTMSSVAMDTEFQMLNAKLSAKADAIELAEEQMWRIWAEYQGKVWDGMIDYPDDFSINDKGKDFLHLQMAKSAATDPRVLQVIDHELISALGEDADLIMPEYVATEAANFPARPPFEAHQMSNPETGDKVIARTNQEHLDYGSQGYIDIEENHRP